MTPTKIRELLAEHADRVDPEEYAAVLFHVHGDHDHYEQCVRDLRARRRS